MQVDDLSKLAEDIRSIETKSAALTADWRHFERGDASDVAELKRLSVRSEAYLEKLASGLQQRLRETQDDGRLAQAYNIVAELRQSRSAVQSLLDPMSGSDGQSYFEYFRALAIKEKAAATQAAQLSKLLSM